MFEISAAARKFNDNEDEPAELTGSVNGWKTTNYTTGNALFLKGISHIMSNETTVWSVDPRRPMGTCTSAVEWGFSRSVW